MVGAVKLASRFGVQGSGFRANEEAHGLGVSAVLPHDHKDLELVVYLSLVLGGLYEPS